MTSDPGTVEGVMEISTDRARLDVAFIHRYLSQDSYWARGISLALVQRSIEHSLCFGGYLRDRQVAFARVVTDRATSAHLKDVFVDPALRGHGYGVEIVQAVMHHPDLAHVAFTLGTADAHSLYTRFGFAALPEPHRSMLRPGTFLSAGKGPGA